MLSLPVQAQRMDTIAHRDFAKCICKNIDVWFAFAQGLGLGVRRIEDIVLVTGRDLARSSLNVAFSDCEGGEQVSFGVRVTGTSGVEWQVSHEDIQGAAVNFGPSDKVRSHCLYQHFNSAWIDLTISESSRGSVYIRKGVPCHSTFRDNSKASSSSRAKFYSRSR
jgi:hypothetical protein